VGPDRVSGEILKLCGGSRDSVHCEIAMNNGALLGDSTTAMVIPIHKGVIDH